MNLSDEKKLLRNRKIGIKNLVPPFKLSFNLVLKSLNPQGPWKNILHYGNNDSERGLAVWLYPRNPPAGPKLRNL